MRGGGIIWKQCLLLFACVLATTSLQASASFDHGHHAWDELLQRHVKWLNGDVASAVNYPALLQDQVALDNYLGSLSAVEENEYSQWPEDQQLAFLINAYNAFTVKLILDHWPVESIRDIGGLFRNPWKMRFFELLGNQRHLDWIEHEVIREPGRFNEPRIHFAVNCAAIGCPALRPEAYVGDRLDSQLEDQTCRFLSDTSRNRIQGNALKLSSIFKWYREDFQRGWQNIDSLSEFLALHAEALGPSSTALDKRSLNQLEIEFLDYDWQLNTSD